MTEYRGIKFIQIGEPMKVESIVTWTNDYAVTPQPPFPGVEKIIFNPPCTIVIWSDKTKTVVRCTEDDKFSEDSGFATAVIRKLYGSRRAYQKLIAKADHQPKEKK